MGRHARKSREAWVALRNFHNTKVREMNGTTGWHPRSFRLRDADLRAWLGLSCIETSVAHRAIQWCGHVTRMTAERLPHRLMFAWVRHPRPDGGRPTSLGDTLRVHLRRLPGGSDGGQRMDLYGQGPARAFRDKKEWYEEWAMTAVQASHVPCLLRLIIRDSYLTPYLPLTACPRGTGLGTRRH